VCVYMSAHVLVYACVCVCVCVYMHVCVCKHICVCVCMDEGDRQLADFQWQLYHNTVLFSLCYMQFCSVALSLQ